MTVSIRNFLIINLLLSVILITSLSMIANFFLVNKDLQDNLDEKLTQSAFAIQAFMSQTPSIESLNRIQANIDAIPSIHYPIQFHKQASYFSSYFIEPFQFEVRTAKGKLVLHSATLLPPNFIEAPPGLSFGSYK